MRSWKTVAISDVATIERESVDAANIPSGTVYVGLENIQSGGRLINIRTVDGGELASNKFVFGPQHLLYGKLRPYLAKIGRPTFAGICSTDILPVLPGPELDRDYLAHFLLQPELISLADSRATGVNLPRLSPKVLAEFQIPLPPLSEQRRIAEVLDRAEALRGKRLAALTQADGLRQAIFLEMFGDPATNPMGWVQVKLGETLASGPQNGLYKPADDYGSGTPILRIDGFYDGVVTQLATLKRVRLSDKEICLYGLNEGEIVLNRVNSMEYLGKSALIPRLYESSVFESNMMRFDVDRNRLQPEYLIQFLQTEFIKSQILTAAKHAVNQSSINQHDVRGFRINIPPLSLQREFARRITALERMKATQRTSLAELDALFASLQHRAFRGKL